MERIRSIFSAHKRILVAIVVLCCFALSALCMLPVFAIGDTDAGGGSQTEVTTPQKAVAKPLHDYIDLKVTTPENLFVYAGATTVGQLKNNLTVTGTYYPNPNVQNTATAVLSPSEYVLMKADGSPIDKADNEPIEDSAGGYYFNISR